MVNSKYKTKHVVSYISKDEFLKKISIDTIQKTKKLLRNDKREFLDMTFQGRVNTDKFENFQARRQKLFV